MYLVTSVWYDLSKHLDRERITDGIKRLRLMVHASVLSAAEILRTCDVERRRLTRAIVPQLQGDTWTVPVLIRRSLTPARLSPPSIGLLGAHPV